MNGSSKIKPFNNGYVFHSEDGQSFRVTGFLGQGGQGNAYRVVGPGGEWAVKWYHTDYLNKINADLFYRMLRQNAENGIPHLSNGDAAEQFVWPLKMIAPANGSFGYVMKLFPQGYEPFSNIIMLRRKDKNTGAVTQLRWRSWFMQITAALNIVDAFEILHRRGMSYQDLNTGAVSINMETGDALICDCDNVCPDGTNLGIKGTLDYMAPEVLLGKTLPDQTTDIYSLAVILFRLFLHGHPMHGMESARLNNDDKVSQKEAGLRIYGSNPHYVLAPGNNPNPPDPQRNRDVYQLRNVMPPILMKAFQQVFTDGLSDWHRRLSATDWRKVLLRMRDSLVLVNSREQFYNPDRPQDLPAECRTLVYPRGRRVLCMPGKILYKYHLSEYGTDFSTPVGKIISTKVPGLIGLYNATGAPIKYADGKVCPDRERMPLVPGMTMEMNGLSIRVE